MIISNNINPERDLYYLGSQVIEVLNSYGDEKIDYFDLYKTINNKINISFSLYSIVLDWLFIIGAIDNAENGMMKKCF